MPAAHARPGLTRLVAVTAVAVFAQMLLGSWVTGQDAGLAFGDVPLMNGALRARDRAPSPGGPCGASGA